ncbi:MAG: GTP-binding protein, partial [Lachnoanaerobaculum saburreum]
MINIGVLSHVDAGKTTLTEAMLYKTGKLRKVGRVDFGDSFLDTDEYERKRGITIFSKIARTKIGDMNINIIDTPGHIDFGAEMERCISVLDMAILVISGSEGVQSHSHTLFKLLKEANIPVLIFVNKTDSDKFDKDKVMEGLKKSLSNNVVDFSTDKKMLEEEVAACDEGLIEKFIKGEKITKEDITECIQSAKVFPVIFGSALKLINIEGILDFIKEYI